MEFFDLYNFDRSKTGESIMRGGKIPAGKYRVVVHICVFGENGKMLIQQRSDNKKDWAGKWDISAGGSVISGETSGEGASRELFEEIGIKADLAKVHPAFTTYWENIFDDYYVISGCPELSELKLQRREVSAVRMADREEILSLLRRGDFVPYKESVIKILFDMQNGFGALKI